MLFKFTLNEARPERWIYYIFNSWSLRFVSFLSHRNTNKSREQKLQGYYRLFILESHSQKPNVSKIIRLKNDRDPRVMILDITSSISNIKKKRNAIKIRNNFHACSTFLQNNLSPPCEDTCISTEISIGQNDKTGFERSRWINNAF